jgi:ABC-2 type transport system permease protein
MAVVSGAVIYSSVFIGSAAIAFWLVDASEVGNSFTYGGSFLSNQPLDIYAHWLRTFASFVVPLAFATYLPVAWSLGKPVAAPLRAGMVWMTPVVALAAAAGARRLWRRGVRRYRSTGT